MHIKVDDIVVILKGQQSPFTVNSKEDEQRRSDAATVRVKGKSGVTKEYSCGKVLKLYTEKGRVLVEGVNKVLKHMRKSRQNPRGGRLHKEMPVSISNVMLLCPKCSKPTRTSVKVGADGVKNRVCKQCNAEIGAISKSKKKAKTGAK